MAQRLAVLSACAVALAASAWPATARAVRSSAAKAALEAFTHQTPAAERVLNHSARRRVDPDQFAAQTAHEPGHDDEWDVYLAAGSPLAAADELSDCNEAVARAIELLPRRPPKVVVVDANHATPLLRQAIQHVDGFVTTGQQVVYLRAQAPMMQQACKGPGIFDYMIATIIWHEMAHLDGADERAAQAAEEQLWTQFLLAGKVDRNGGSRYLALLRKRHYARERRNGRPSG